MQCPKDGPRDPNFKLRSYQRKVVDFFLKSPNRGMIFYHGLGAGKTVTSLSFAIEYIKQKPDHKIHIITPGSLRFNFIREYCNFLGHPEYMGRFEFLSYNYTALPRILDNYNFNNSVVIIDEFHNLINGARNLSPNYVALYQKLHYSENVKIVLLSGTPLIYYPYELALMYNLCKKDIFPISPSEFDKVCWISGDQLKFADRKKFMESLTGCLSYVRDLGEEYYPKVINMPDTKVTITDYQLPFYVRQRIKEIRMSVPEQMITKNYNVLTDQKKVKKKKPNPAKYLAYSMLLSRQVGNFCYPEPYQKTLLGDPKKRLKVPLDTEIEIDMKKLKTHYSPKFDILLRRIKKLPGKHLVYTQYLNRYGVKLLHHLMSKIGITSLSYTGNIGTDEERNYVLDTFNASNNINGARVKVMLTTSAGTQGLTLLETNYVHIIEPHRSEMFIQQLIGRAVRFKSHERIKNTRNFVKVYRYYTYLPKDKSVKDLSFEGRPLKEKKSADQQVKEMAATRVIIIKPLLEMMKETAVDCSENYEGTCFEGNISISKNKKNNTNRKKPIKRK